MGRLSPDAAGDPERRAPPPIGPDGPRDRDFRDCRRSVAWSMVGSHDGSSDRRPSART